MHLRDIFHANHSEHMSEDIILTTPAQLKSLLIESVSIALKYYQPTYPTAPDAEPYGDFKWLQTVCAGVPSSSLRIKSAAGEIPGVVKFGKRVLYNKAEVLNWLRSQTRQPAPGAAQIEQAAETQVTTRIAERRKGRII